MPASDQEITDAITTIFASEASENDVVVVGDIKPFAGVKRVVHVTVRRSVVISVVIEDGVELPELNARAVRTTNQIAPLLAAS